MHFRGKRPIPRLPKLASSCARPAAALRDLLVVEIPVRARKGQAIGLAAERDLTNEQMVFGVAPGLAGLGREVEAHTER